MIFWHFLKQKRKKKIQKKKHNDRIIKNRRTRDVTILFEQEENYYKPENVSNFSNNNYIEYESNGYKTETYHLMNIIIGLQKSNA